MHLMDETPDMIEKITSKQKEDKTIKKKNKEERITKAQKKGTPEDVQQIGKLYKTTNKENRMNIENAGIEKQKKENDQIKKEKEDKNRIKSATELSKFKVPKTNKNLETEIQIERTKKKRREAVGSFKRIMTKIILAEKLKQERKLEC